MGNSKNRTRKKKRIPPLKKTKKFQHGEPSYKDPGPSAEKIAQNTAKFSGIFPNKETALKEGTIVIDLSVLFGVFDGLLKCPECDTSLHIDIKKRNGYSNYVVLQCKDMDCEWKHCFNTSKKQGHSHEVNVRAVLAFRDIGRGHNAMTTFSKVMNMPAPPARSAFTKIQNKKVLPVVRQLATDSMVSSAFKVREENANEDGECGVSIGGTWEKRGHTSHDGIVTVISLDTKKCLDADVLSDRCQQCQKWQHKTNDPRYDEWKASHTVKSTTQGALIAWRR